MRHPGARHSICFEGRATNAECGLRLGAAELVSGAEMDLSEGIVEGHEIGACILTPDYDIDRLSNEVEYRDNGTNLDAPVLPVPTPRDSLESSQ